MRQPVMTALTPLLDRVQILEWLSELETFDPDLVRNTEGNYSAEDILGTGAGK